MELRKFKKKPVEIEALQWSGDVIDFDYVYYWMDEDPNLKMEYNNEYGNAQDVLLMIHTLEGTMVAQPKDWIIKGVKGEFYPCKPDIFEATYEEVK